MRSKKYGGVKMEITISISKERKQGISKDGKPYDFEATVLTFPNGAKMDLPKLNNFNMDVHVYLRGLLNQGGA